jgi:hypothetical protein
VESDDLTLELASNEKAAHVGRPLHLRRMNLADASFRYKVGGIEVTVLTDGFRMVPADGNYLRNASADELAAALKAAGLPTDRMKNTYSPIVLTTVGQRVLFDTGNGEAGAAQSRARESAERSTKISPPPASIAMPSTWW